MEAPKRSRGKPRFDEAVKRISFSVTTHPQTREAMVTAARAKELSVGKYLDRIFELVVTGTNSAEPAALRPTNEIET